MSVAVDLSTNRVVKSTDGDRVIRQDILAVAIGGSKTAGNVLVSNGSSAVGYDGLNFNNGTGNLTATQFNGVALTAVGDGLSFLANDGTYKTATIAEDTTLVKRDASRDVDAIQFNLTSAPAHSEGMISWNDDDKTMDIHTEVDGTKIQVGQEQVLRVTNKTGVAILNGQVVYINGAQGNRPTIALADADSSATSDYTIGVVTADIADNATGYVTTFGLCRDIDTSLYAEGTQLWLSQTAGAFTDTKPSSPAHGVRVGIVVRQHATLGVILVHVDTGSHLTDLHDVKIEGIVNDQVLKYNSTSGLWENVADKVIGVDVQAFDAGLQSISDLTTSADQMIFTTASDTYATTSLTAYARTLLDDTDAPTARATLNAVGGRSTLTLNKILKADANGDAVDSIVTDDGTTVTVSGNFHVTGTTTQINSEVTVHDPLIKLAYDNTGDAIDLGFYARYNDGTDRYTGLFRDTSASRYKLFKGLTVEPTTTVDTADGSFAFSDLELGKLFVSDTTDTTGAGTGSAQIAGGLYVAKKIHSNDDIVIGNIAKSLVTDNIKSFSGGITVLSSSVNFTDQFSNDLFRVGTNSSTAYKVFYCADATDTTGAGTGAVQITGGLYTAKQIRSGSSIHGITAITVTDPAGPAGIWCYRTDGTSKAAAFGAGSGNAYFRFDSTGGLSIQGQPRADLNARNGSNTIEVLNFSGSTVASDKLSVKYTLDASSSTVAGTVLDGGLAVAKQIRAGGNITGAQISGTNILASNLVKITKNAINTLQMDSGTASGATGAFWMQNGVDKYGLYLDSSNRLVWYDDITNRVIKDFDGATRQMTWYYGAGQTLATINHNTGSMTMNRLLTCNAGITVSSNATFSGNFFCNNGTIDSIWHNPVGEQTVFKTDTQYATGIIKIDNVNANAGDRFASLGWYDNGTLKHDIYWYNGALEIYNNDATKNPASIVAISISDTNEVITFGSTLEATAVGVAGGVFNGGVGVAKNLIVGGNVIINDAELQIKNASGAKLTIDVDDNFYGEGYYFKNNAGNSFLSFASDTDYVQLGVFTGAKVRLGITGGGMGFYGVTPITKPTALTAEDGATVDATYGTEEQGVITNLRTRIGELESKLQALGLIA